MSEIDAQRRAALAARRRLTATQRNRYSRLACARLARLPVFRRARDIGIYWSLKSEADTWPLLAHMTAFQTCYLPRIRDGALVFVPIDSTDFRRRRAGVGTIEPLGSPARRARVLDLIVMPLAAFDSGARRIGMGGGFYDRTLATCSGWRPCLAGLALEAQRIVRIPTRPWDIDLDMVVTEAGVDRPAYQCIR